MITFFGSPAIDKNYPSRAVVAIGNFDGVHLGHQEIIRRAQALGVKHACPVVCLTFNPHPTLELRPESHLRLLMTYEEKRNTLAQYGVEFCVEEKFDHELAQTTADYFFHEILKARLHAVAIVVGGNFAFGKQREGTIDVMARFCAETGTELEIVPSFLVKDAPVSSSRIRQALSSGNLDLATELLGRPFSYRGEVVHGDKRGRTIGFPTANMRCEEKFPLKPGVYATSVVWREKEYPSVTNIGTRPTFSATELKIETHILDKTLELYGEILEVRFHAPIRQEVKFASIDELKAQILADTILAKQLLQKRHF